MRVSINEPLVAKRATGARRAVSLGIVMMMIAFGLSFNPDFLIPAYVLMVGGVVLLNSAGRAVGKWLAKPRADQMLAKALKSVNHQHRLYSYLLPADHVILSPTGLFVLRAKTHGGKISCHGDKWRSPFNWRQLWRALSQEPLANPTKQVQKDVEEMRSFLAARLPDIDVPLQPVVVFVDPYAELDVADCTVPALHLRDLKAYLRDAELGAAMPAGTLEALTNVLDERSS